MSGRGRRHINRVASGARVPLAALAGAIAAIAIAGPVTARIGPFDTAVTPRPGWSGETRVLLGPLGSIALDTHDAPVDVVMRVDQLRVDEAERIVRDPSVLNALESELVGDAQRALRILALRTVAVSVLGGAVGAWLVRARWRLVTGGAAVGALLPLSLGAATAMTFNPASIAEPRYSGLLTVAPNAIGSVQSVVDRFDDYSAQVAGLVGNVAGLYRAAQGLPTADLGDDTIRLLHVSDIHLNPQAFSLIGQLVSQFDIDAVLDTGDTTDWGSQPEARLLGGIGEIGVPYLWVRGNHDSPATQQAVGAQPNAIVLDGQSALVDGVRVWGVGDPRFTPDKDRPTGQDVERAAAEDFAPKVAQMLRSESPRPDVVLVHDPRFAADLDGLVPLVLAGHTHKPRHERHDGTILLVEGSTGGAGFRALEGEVPQPLECAVLYLDPDTKRLIAYDRVSVDGLGSNGARIQRKVVRGADQD